MIYIQVLITQEQINSITEMMNTTNSMIGCSSSGDDGLPSWDENTIRRNKKIHKFLKFNKLIK